MKIKVGINGMGRIGRMILRAIIESNNKNIEIKHINNRTNSESCSTLLKYDSIHGKFNAELNFGDDYLTVNKNKISLSLIASGAIGNVLDRINDGSVTDFLHLEIYNYSLFVFNLADAFITIGAILIIYFEIRRNTV